MSHTLNAFNNRQWVSHGLQNYEDFSDCIGECNQMEFGDHTTGQWFFIPEKPLPVTEDCPQERRVIYHGSWGNDNSPGASSYTYATIYDMPDDQEEYESDKEEWENQPEWAPQDMPCMECGSEFDKSEMEFDDRRDGYICEECQKKRDNTSEEEDFGSDEGDPD